MPTEKKVFRSLPDRNKEAAEFMQEHVDEMSWNRPDSRDALVLGGYTDRVRNSSDAAETITAIERIIHRNVAQIMDMMEKSFLGAATLTALHDEIAFQRNMGGILFNAGRIAANRPMPTRTCC